LALLTLPLAFGRHYFNLQPLATQAAWHYFNFQPATCNLLQPEQPGIILTFNLQPSTFNLQPREAARQPLSEPVRNGRQAVCISTT